MAHLICFIIYAIYTYTTSAKNCSAINSYIQVTEPLALQRTILSSQALFPPYLYYISPTELVQLSTNDDICSSSLTTDITDKIVLIMPENAEDCSYKTRAFNAQQNGAKAVIVANDEKASGDVIEIVNDNPDIQTTIPIRMVAYNSGKYLALELNAGDDIKIEFGCRAVTNISSVLCFVDLSGDHWWMDGDYQLQIGRTQNEHPIWRKNGYLLVLDADLYIFLHVAGQESWYWAITEDPKMNDDEQIVAKCSLGSIDNPVDCSVWFTKETSSSSQLTFTLNENIKINDTLCEITDNYICIKSSQSQLAGLYGTYRQFNALAPYWFREWVDCDTQPGYLTFIDYGESGVFMLIDPFDYWVVAECTVFVNIDENMAFHPELCDEWNTLVDGSMDAKHKIYDGTMSVTLNECVDDSCPSEKIVPNEICMQRNNVMHSFLEGEYQITGVKGNKLNTSEWIRTNKLYYQGEYVPVYVWYYGEVNDDLNWWVIAMNNLTTAQANNGSSVYGYCASSTVSPTHCMSCWNFYFSGEANIDGAWHADCTFSMTAVDGDCGLDVNRPDHIDWPEFLCVKDVFLMTANATIVYSGDVNFDLLIGGYEINTVGAHGIPIWIKPANDYIDNETYIYYDKFYGYWQIGHSLEIQSATLFCMEDASDYLPTDCNEWYDTKSNILNNLFLYSNGCSRKDILVQSELVSKKNNGKIIIIVLIILALIACSVAGFFYYKNQTKSIFKGHETIGFESTRDIELGDDVDQINLKTNMVQSSFDMSPLNVEGDDEDDLTIDAQQHDVVDVVDHDDGDGDEQQLIGDLDTKKSHDNDSDGGESDPDLRMPESDDDEDEDEDENLTQNAPDTIQ